MKTECSGFGKQTFFLDFGISETNLIETFIVRVGIGTDWSAKSLAGRPLLVSPGSS